MKSVDIITTNTINGHPESQQEQEKGGKRDI